ncbi:MAG: bifunctional UDP-N-acetylmuramoyl-tripeptide:D-alanyl-D-alanine ligase/alanine racemase [Saprospiraceae bacterium]|nr:bifunctional UDP-N-acetylmuramoyl-tripeptide:D-alanyl-D-alanine ligase/alanine racemase [Lewinella sp.]
MGIGPYTIRQIKDIIQAQSFGTASLDVPITYLLTDSRKIRFPGQSLFFALKGPHHDGHLFLDQAYEKGIRYFVVTHIPGQWSHPDCVLLVVPGPLSALQQLSRYHRQQFTLPVIAITGSNGKTTVKEWLFQLLHEYYYILRSPRSFNSQVGVPLSVWPLRAEHQLAIFEAGISQTGEMQALADIIQPTIGILTNIGPAHDAGFKDRRQKLEEKLLLFQDVEVLIHRADDDMINQTIAHSGIPTFSWAFDHEADLRIISHTIKDGKTSINGNFHGQAVQAQIPFTDNAGIENAIHCWATSLYLGCSAAELPSRMAQLSPISMRMELREGRNGCTLIDDSYNSDLHSLALALDFAQQQRGDAHLCLILSDILQSGISSDELYREVAQLISQHRVDRFIGVGNKIIQLEKWLPATLNQYFFPNTAALLEAMDDLAFHNETILIKGARSFTFEDIAQRLLPATHRTLLEVNLSALAHNLRAFRARIKPDTHMMVMVKAAAYGGGSPEIARLLRFQGIQYLGVAYVDEGVELRNAGISLPIMVLNPEPVTFPQLLHYQLEPEIYGLSQLKALVQFVRQKNTRLAIHLKLDTGMHRLGFMEEDLAPLIHLLQEYPQLRVASIFSHLAVSEDAAEDDFTREQVAVFTRFYDRIVQSLPYRPIRHILNSSGIARFPQYQMDMVRLGIGIYGIETCREMSGQLRPAFQLRSRISQIRRVPPGETIGYGRRDPAPHPRLIATVSIGYADGLLRKAGNGRYAVLVQDQPAATVGNICMDMCMVDITHIPNAREGDEVIVFGEELPIEQLAETMETIPYEVLTGISGRVKRLYLFE